MQTSECMPLLRQQSNEHLPFVIARLTIRTFLTDEIVVSLTDLPDS